MRHPLGLMPQKQQKMSSGKPGPCQQSRRGPEVINAYDKTISVTIIVLRDLVTLISVQHSVLSSIHCKKHKKSVLGDVHVTYSYRQISCRYATSIKIYFALC